MKVPSRSIQYSKILDQRQKVDEITLDQFKNSNQYKSKDIWELNYHSTSDDQDEETDTEEDDSESDYDDEENEEKKKDEP